MISKWNPKSNFFHHPLQHNLIFEGNRFTCPQGYFGWKGLRGFSLKMIVNSDCRDNKCLSANKCINTSPILLCTPLRMPNQGVYPTVGEVPILILLILLEPPPKACGRDIFAEGSRENRNVWAAAGDGRRRQALGPPPGSCRFVCGFLCLSLGFICFPWTRDDIGLSLSLFLLIFTHSHSISIWQGQSHDFGHTSDDAYGQRKF